MAETLEEHGDSDTVVDVASISKMSSFHFLDFLQKYEIKMSLININIHDTNMETLQDIKHLSINEKNTLFGMMILEFPIIALR